MSITMTKKCIKCNLPKPTERFRFRSKNGYKWQRTVCMDCEAKEQRGRNLKRKDDADYKAKNAAKTREYYKNNPEKIKAYRQAKKLCSTNPEYSEYRKKYWQEKEEQRLKHKQRARKHFEYARDNLTDSYIIGKIIQRTKLKREDIPNELIEVWRQKTLLNRLLKEKSNKDSDLSP